MDEVRGGIAFGDRKLSGPIVEGLACERLRWNIRKDRVETRLQPGAMVQDANPRRLRAAWDYRHVVVVGMKYFDMGRYCDEVFSSSQVNAGDLWFQLVNY